MNKVILTGRLTRDIELRYTRTNAPTASFTLAVDKALTKEKKEEAQRNNYPTADFPRVVVFGKQAENASMYLGKGSRCLIEGRILTGSYQDKDGKTIYTTDVLADRVEFLDSQNNAQNNAGATKGQNEYNYMPSNDETHTGQNRDDFFEDDFEEVQDDGRISF